MELLWKEGCAPLFDKNIGQNEPNVEAYIAEGAKSCVVVCAGGAYLRKAEHEAGVICKWLNSIGVSAFNLDYRVAPYQYPADQYDAKRAIKYARSKAKEYGYDEDKIGIMGFSAGGHLACSAGVLYGELGYEAQDEIDRFSSRPDFMLLCYPVVSFTKYAHLGSMRNLIGDASYEEAAKLSLENRVDENTCPAFIWHTSNDEAVPVENSMMLMAAMRKYNIPVEFHSFVDGRHGLGLAEDNESVGQWTGLCAQWLKKMGFR